MNKYTMAEKNETDKKYGVLFVCLGNICRSPAAEEIFRTRLRRQSVEELVEVDSAGTYGGHAGDLPDERMRSETGKRGYKLTHRARRLTEDDFRKFDMVIVMDDSNYERASRIAPDIESLNKLYRMTDFKSVSRWDHVPDPYYEGIEGFRLVIDLLEECIDGLTRKLEEDNILPRHA